MPLALRRCVVVIVAAIALSTLSALSAPSAWSVAAPSPTTRTGTDSGPWVWPLAPLPEVVGAFDPPDSPWLPGHRGVDLLGHQAQRVSSIGSGTVSFAGVVAGRGVVVVTHGTLRSTYEPVTASVGVGTTVAAGEMIGLLQSVRSHCLPSVCLHLGVRRGDTYLDPLELLGPRPVRLKPWSGQPPARAATTTDQQASFTTTHDAATRRSGGAGDRSPTVPLALGLGLAGLTGAWVTASARRHQARG